ncbi:MAG: metal ABC transporter permease, partial [Tumebacillaceae bacterium]
MSDLFVNIDWAEMWQAFGETMYMVGISTLFTAIIGLPLGILVVLTSPGHLLQNRVVYQILSIIINVFRSIPF